VAAAAVIAAGAGGAAIAAAAGFLAGRRRSNGTGPSDALAQMSRLQQITGALAATSTVADVAAVVTGDVRRAIGAAAASLSDVHGEDATLLGAVGYAPEALEQWARFTVAGDTLFRDAAFGRRLVVAETREQLATQWPEMIPLVPETRQSIAALPLVIEGQTRAIVGFGFDTARRFSVDDQAFLLAVGSQCADALARAQLRALSQTATARVAFLAEASTALGSSLDTDSTLRHIAELAVPRLADIAAVYVVRDEVVALEIAHANPARAAHFRSIADRWRPDLQQAVGIGAVARTGEPLFITAITEEQVRAGGRDAAHADALASLSLDSFLAVPMRSQDTVIGLIVLATERPRRLSEGDFLLATELAARAAQAIVNAELYRERYEVAATLQASLRPPATPTIPDLDLAARFFALGEGIDVGGDFYDVFPLESDGGWVVTIGDVRGKGIEAASTSNAARHAIRTAALREHSPSAMLRQLNQVLLGLDDGQDVEPRFCTAVVATVQPSAGGAEITVAVGGHPAPFVQRANGTIESLEGSGTLLGVLDDPELSDSTLSLGPGDSLVLYTDGVTERHAGNRFFDEEGLASVLNRCVGFTAAVVAERIELASRAFVEDAPRDDLAIVVLRVPEAVTNTSATNTDLPLDLTAPRLARRFVTAALDAMKSAVVADIAALLASELVTNSVVHATGPLRVSVEAVEEGAVRVTVTDGSDVAPQLRDPGPEATSGRGILLVDRLARRWGADVTASGKAVWFELGE
jgi:serine phosphatase RsbU (regulator of sigma subunit)